LVSSQLLQLNDIRFEELVREATYTKANEDEVLEQIERLDPKLLEKLEQATGVALATSHVDLTQIRRTQSQDYVSEEQRLMPRYVEEFFKRACEFMRVNLDNRADGLWRVSYVKEEFRSNNLEAVRRLGTPEKEYLKLTFYKEHLAAAVHQDADLLSPGHPLFAAIIERLDIQLWGKIAQNSAIFIDADTQQPYRIHFFEVQVAGVGRQAKDTVLKARLCAVAEKSTGELALISPDCLHDLAPAPPSVIANEVKQSQAESNYPGMQNDPEVEAFAMQYVMDYERQRGWEPEDVSKKQDGSGFDIRSVGQVDEKTEIAPVRRIEVKGRSQSNQEVSLTINGWRKAQQLGESYWLYVVWGCNTDNPQLLTIQNPAKVLALDAKEIKQVTRYIVGAAALQQNAVS
jgi:Domain of unknown function (DUF3883)